MRDMKRVCIISIMMLIWAGSSAAFEIIEPVEGQRVEVGSAMRVVVKPQPGESLKIVGIAFEPLTFDGNLGVYIGVFPVPSETRLGPRELLITALSEGDQEIVSKRTVIVALPPSLRLQSIQADPKEMFLRKLPSGSDPNKVRFEERERLVVMGQFSDGVEREVSFPEAGTTYQTSNPEIALVNSDGMVTAVSPGKTIIKVMNGDYAVQVSVAVRASQ